MEGPNHPENYGQTLERILFDGFSQVVHYRVPVLIFVTNLHFTGSFFDAVLRIGAPGYLPDETNVLRTQSRKQFFNTH